MNGAVQGDAIATASNPDANAFAPRFECDHVATLDGSSEPNSNTPDRFSAITKNSSASALTTAGDCSWKPHPSCSPAARRPTIAAPSSTNATMTPAANATPSRRIAPRLCAPEATSTSAFSDSTGNTHGIRFNSSPPPSANASASGNDNVVAGADAPKSVTGAPAAGLGPGVGVPVT